MGTCLSKKKGSSSSTASSPATKPAEPEQKNKNPEENAVAVTKSKPKVEEQSDPQVKLKNKENNNSNNDKTLQVQEKHEPLQQEEDDEDKGHDAQKIEVSESTMCGDKVAPAATNMGVVGVVGVMRTSSCTKEEVDAILLHCGRLSRSSSGKAATSSAAARRYSGSKRSYDFDHCENDTISNDEEQKKANANGNNSGLCEDDGLANGEKSSRQHRQRNRRSPRPSPEGRRRRTPSREREQQHSNAASSSRERRVSRSPGRRTSETATTPSSNASNNSNNSNNNNTSSRPGKMISVPASVTPSHMMDKSNNFGGGSGGESATATGVKRINVKRNVGAASPRSQSPARSNGNAANARVFLSENQHQQSSLSRNNSRKAEQSPSRRNPLGEVDPNSLAYPQSTSNNGSSRVQNKPKKEIETEANQQKQNAISRGSLDKGVNANCKRKVQQEEDVKVESSMIDNVVVKTVVPPGIDNLKPNQTLTRSRSSRRSQDLDLNPEALLVPPQSYTSLLLEDIQNFHQKNTPSVSFPACVTKACSILEAVADLNSTTTEDRRIPPTYQSSRNECNVPLSTNHFGKRVTNNKDPFVESEVVVNDDVMEPSFHKYVTVSRGGSPCGVDMEDQESSGSNSFTFSSGQQHWGISSASWEPSSADSRDCLTSRLNYSREEGQKSPLGLKGGVSSEAVSDGDGVSKKLNSKSRECDHQHSGGIGRGKAGAIRDLHTIPVVTAAGST